MWYFLWFLATVLLIGFTLFFALRYERKMSNTEEETKKPAAKKKAGAGKLRIVKS